VRKLKPIQHESGTLQSHTHELHLAYWECLGHLAPSLLSSFVADSSLELTNVRYITLYSGYGYDYQLGSRKGLDKQHQVWQ
jgi:hypothetical protein